MIFYKKLDTERVIHGVKTALACILGFVVTRSINFQIDQWLIITVLVVMCGQLSVGSMIQKSSMRFLGTLIGTILAALTISIFGVNPLAIAAMVSIAGLIFSYIATGQSTYNEAGTLGAVTIAIILLSQHPTILLAFHRFVEISIGILLAALVSQFVIPIQARNHLEHNQAETLKKLRDYYFSVLMHHENQEINVTEQTMDEDIAKSLIQQRKLAKESAKEFFGEAFNVKHFTQLLWCEKEVLRCITFMHHAFKHLDIKIKKMDLTELKNFNRTVCRALEDISYFIENKKIEKLTLPNIQLLKNAFRSLDNLEKEELIYVDAFLFCAEVLVERLSEMHKLNVTLST